MLRSSLGTRRPGKHRTEAAPLAYQLRQVDQRTAKDGHVVQIDGVGQDVDREEGVEQRAIEGELAAGPSEPSCRLTANSRLPSLTAP